MKINVCDVCFYSKPEKISKSFVRSGYRNGLKVSLCECHKGVLKQENVNRPEKMLDFMEKMMAGELNCQKADEKKPGLVGSFQLKIDSMKKYGLIEEFNDVNYAYGQADMMDPPKWVMTGNNGKFWMMKAIDAAPLVMIGFKVAERGCQKPSDI